MTNNTTKRALLSSALALFLCFVMLIGTTFAWFTDEVSSQGNVIEAGTLDVQLFQHFENSSVEITESSDPIFGKADSESANANTADTLWEPGKTQTVYLSIKNNGSLDLKYKVAIEVTNVEKNLHEVMEYIITPDAQYGSVTKADLNWNNGIAVNPGINFATTGDVALEAGLEHFFALSVHMDDLAGNDYQGGNITFNIKVLAGQLASEEDSFDNQYDADATYPDGFVTLPAAEEFPAAGYEIPYYDDNGDKIGTITVPAAALPEGATDLVYTVTPKAVDPNFVAGTGALNSYAFDINVVGLVEGNTAPILTSVRIDKDLEGDIYVYHYDQLVEVESYHAESGMVNFYTTSYSPFTVVEVPAGATPDNQVPKAELVACPEYVNNSDIKWGSYGQWSPTAGLESTLDVCYKFVAPHDANTVEACAYKDWWVDFVLSLDCDLEGKNEIFLGGNYGTWGWVGFHSGNLELAANTEVPVLASASGREEKRISGWTYDDVASFVGEFMCGVGDVDNALAGQTITVTLRLTNPNNLDEQIDVNTVTFTFPAAPVVEE